MQYLEDIIHGRKYRIKDVGFSHNFNKAVESEKARNALVIMDELIDLINEQSCIRKNTIEMLKPWR